LAGCGRKPSADVAASASSSVPEAWQPESAAPAMPPVVAAVDPQSPVVTVNGTSLTRGDLDARLRDMIQRRGIPADMVDRALASMGPQIERQIIEQFVDSSILLSEADRRGFAVSNEECDEVIAKIAKQLPPGMTIDQALAEEGVTMDELRLDISRGERIRKLLDQMTTNVAAVADEAVADFYKNNLDRFKTPEQVAASHILIACEESATPDEHTKAKADAEAIRVRLTGGADFATVAKESSACPSRDRGGDLGRFGRGQMTPTFEEAAFAQAVGEIGPVVKTPFGYHIIKVTEHSPAGQQSLDEVKESVRQYLQNQDRDEVIKKAIEELRSTANIVYHQDGEATEPVEAVKPSEGTEPLPVAEPPKATEEPKAAE